MRVSKGTKFHDMCASNTRSCSSAFALNNNERKLTSGISRSNSSLWKKRKENRDHVLGTALSLFSWGGRENSFDMRNRQLFLVIFAVVALLYAGLFVHQHSQMFSPASHDGASASTLDLPLVVDDSTPLPRRRRKSVAICMFGLLKNVDDALARSYRTHLMKPLWDAGYSTHTVLISNAVTAFENPRNGEAANNGVYIEQDVSVLTLKQHMTRSVDDREKQQEQQGGGFRSSAKSEDTFESYLIPTEVADQWIAAGHDDALAPFFIHGNPWPDSSGNLSMRYFLRQQFTLHKLAEWLAEKRSDSFSGVIFVRSDLLFFDSIDVDMFRFVSSADLVDANDDDEDDVLGGNVNRTRRKSQAKAGDTPLDDALAADLEGGGAETTTSRSPITTRRQKRGRRGRRNVPRPLRLAVPSYSMWFDTGFIDKFAMADVASAKIYARRANSLREYAAKKQLHAETFLRDHLCEHGVEVHLTRSPRVARWRLSGLHEPDRLSELKDLSNRNELRWMDPRIHRHRFAVGRKECPQDMWRKYGDRL